MNIGAERIGHGLAAARDPELLEIMAEKQIPVEICITSNLRTGACTEMQEHPVRKFFDQGVMITLNTDDPAMFQTSLNREYEIARQEFNFSEEHLRELARNSIEASFLPVEKKLKFLSQIDFLV
jgi:adenosine deaminase/aminodeoxyfutalosine deaminase